MTETTGQASSPAILLWSMPHGIELIVILLVVLILFGNRLPNMARNLGRSFTEFRKGIKGQPPDPDAKDGGRLPHEEKKESAKAGETAETHRR